jgi:hypothetical protein
MAEMFEAEHRALAEGGQDAQCIPEPGSTLLAGMAVLLICVRRQRQQA